MGIADEDVAEGIHGHAFGRVQSGCHCHHARTGGAACRDLDDAIVSSIRDKDIRNTIQRDGLGTGQATAYGELATAAGATGWDFQDAIVVGIRDVDVARRIHSGERAIKSAPDQGLSRGGDIG